MKKILFAMLIVVGNYHSALATIRMVSNNLGVITQFSVIQDAINASSDGDTVYVHGSNASYNGFELEGKRLVIMGPGWAPDTFLSFRAMIGRSVTIRGARSSGSEFNGLVFVDDVLFIPGNSNDPGVPDNIRMIRNEFQFSRRIRYVGTGASSLYLNHVYEGCYFRRTSLEGSFAISFANFLFRNNIFNSGQISFFSVTNNFVFDHNLFMGGFFSAADRSFKQCEHLLFRNNIFNKINASDSENAAISGTSSCTFSNNITNQAGNNTPWLSNTNIDGGGNVANQSPQMADQSSVNNGSSNHLLNFTIASGPANNSGSDGKDMGLLFDTSGTLNWIESRNSTLSSRIFKITLNSPFVRLGDNLSVTTEARRNNGSSSFLQAEYFIDRDPGLGNGIRVSLASGSNTVSFTFDISTTGLALGSHQVAVRVKQADGVWSLFDMRGFFVHIPPVANAGQDQLITLPANSVTLNGSAVVQTGSATFSWQKISGPGGVITNNNQPIATASSLTRGTYLFELSATDNFNLIDKDTVQIIVNERPVANAGADEVITLPVNAVTLNGSSSFDPGGTIHSFTWAKISGPSEGTITNAGQSIAVSGNLVGGIYEFELTVVDNNGAIGKDVKQVIVNIPPTALAGRNKYFSLPKDSTTLDGSESVDPDGIIALHRWRQIMGPTLATVRNAQQSITVVNHLRAGTYQFTLTVSDNHGGVDIDTITVLVREPDIQHNPVANAGDDRLVIVPEDHAELDGTASNDVHGNGIVSFSWREISGPSEATITGETDKIASVKNLVSGVYRFSLTVTNILGLQDHDTVEVIVTHRPVANAGVDQTIVLPLNKALLNGSASSDADGSITTFLWIKLSGPTGGTIVEPNKAIAKAQDLTQGLYRFMLTVIDNTGVPSSDIVEVRVSASANVQGVSATNSKTAQVSTTDFALQHSERISYLSAYPNPFTQKLIIEVPSNCSGTINDALGRSVIVLSLTAGRNEVSTDSLSPGFYLIVVEKLGTVKMRKD
jgi:hypothetical protein